MKDELSLEAEDYHYKENATLEGYYQYILRRSGSGQMFYLKYALGRLARQYPEANPRQVLVEFFSESVYAYEQYLKRLNRVSRKKRKSPQRKAGQREDGDAVPRQGGGDNPDASQV